MARLKVGLQVRPQHTTFAEYARAWLHADELGVDSLQEVVVDLHRLLRSDLIDASPAQELSQCGGRCARLRAVLSSSAGGIQHMVVKRAAIAHETREYVPSITGGETKADGEPGWIAGIEWLRVEQGEQIAIAPDRSPSGGVFQCWISG